MAPNGIDQISSNSDSGVDAVFVDRDDVSNYNPDQILPESVESICRIRAWLDPTSYDIAGGEYRKHSASHVVGTGDWLTSTDAYKQWLEDDGQGMLWIKGIPGSGKSVMAAKLIDELAKSNPGSPVLFFFFRQIIEANHQPEALLRDWMDQILEYSPPLQKQLKEYLEVGRSIESISMDDMWKDLRMAFTGISGRVFCVADALDEMDSGHEAFLHELASLGQLKPAKVKVLITSRPVPTVEAPLRNFSGLQLRLQENLVDIDISTYVQYTLSRSTVPKNRWQEIADAVPGRANGLFLYAKLAMDAFIEPKANIDAVLSRLPADLNVLYINLLKEHSRRSGVPESIQRLILQAVTHASRPLRLLELAEMIQVNNPDGVERNLKATKDLIRAACGPLLEILADETVSVIHHSFTEYLKGTMRPDDGSGYPILKMGPTHGQLAIACLRYLMAGCLDSYDVNEKDFEVNHDWFDYGGYSREGETSQEEVKLRLKHPFFDYAATAWSFHIRRSETPGQDQTEVNTELHKFLDDTRNRRAWLHLRWNGGYEASGGVTQVHIAAREGLLSYLKDLLQSAEADVADCHGKTALWWAASTGNAAEVRVLIEAGANPDHDDSRHGLKPLHEAASRNHPEVIRALLEAGVSPLTPKTTENPGRRCGNAPRTTGHTPLMYACHNGHLKSVDVFLSFIDDIDTIHQALAWAAEEGRSKVVARILQHPGVDVNATVRGDTPLFHACGVLDFATIECLLKEGADPNIPCEGSEDEFSGIRAIHIHEEIQPPSFNCLHQMCGLVSGGSHYYSANREADNLKAIFSLLMEAGIDIHRRTPSGETALHGAVKSHVLARLLIKAGIDVNATNAAGSTALHGAESLDSIAILVEEGHADIDIAQNNGKTPLLHLLSSYHTEAIQKLLEYGPNCKAVDNEGNSALHISLRQWNSNSDIINGLIKGGADPNLTNREGLTPLLAIRDENKPESIDILLKLGADINAKDKKGSTLLLHKLTTHRSSADNYQDLTRLIDRGADIFVRDREGQTILHHAVWHHDPKRDLNKEQISQFDFLLGLGPDVKAVDYQGNTLLHVLASRNNHDSYHGPPLVSMWEYLVELGLDLGQTNYAEETPLHVLCNHDTSGARFKQGDVMPIDFVLATTNNLEARDMHGATPLHRAVNSSERYTKKLVDAGADPTAVTYEGLTPLHLAARNRDSNTVGYLLDVLRAKSTSTEQFIVAVDAKSFNRMERTPLYYAVRSGRPETVAILLEAGADINKGSVFEACLGFEKEDTLWKIPGKLSDDKSYGIQEEDSRRRKTMTQPYRHLGELVEHETARLEEILEILIQHGADISTFDSHGWEEGHLYNAFQKGALYTAACMRDIQVKCQEGKEDEEDKGSSITFFEQRHRLSKEASIQAIRSSGVIDPGSGKSNQDMLMSLVDHKEYVLIEEMAQLGAEFLPMTEEDSVSNFSVLVKYGFASLVEKVGTIVAKRGLENGNWHAIGDTTQPGLLCARRSLEKPNHKGQNPVPFLLEATQRVLPNMDVIDLLVTKFGVDVNEVFYNYQYMDGEYVTVPYDTALHSVSRGNNWWHVNQALPYLLKAGANLEIRNYQGQTPLHMALKGDGHWPGPYSKDAARALIEAGADVNAVDKDKMSCLACAKHDVDTIKLLIAHGATVAADSILAAIDARNVPVLQLLLSGGADANLRRPKSSEEGSAGLNKRIRHPFYQTPTAAPHEIYPLYQAGMKLREDSTASKENIRDLETGFEIVRVLIDHGADPYAKFLLPGGESTGEEDAETVRESTVLHELLYQGRLTDDFLRIPGLDVNSRDSLGCTLLHAACRGGPDHVLSQDADKPTVFQRLLSLGADLEALDNSGKNILHHMIGDNGEFFDFISFESFENSLEYTIQKAPHLLNQADHSGNTPLHLAVTRAATRGKPDIAKTLLDAGADPHKTDNNGNNLLHKLAPSIGPASLSAFFKDLVHRGVGLEQCNVRGETPLFVFCRTSAKKQRFHPYSAADDEEEITDRGVRMFVKLGADFFVKDNKGRGLLHAAADGYVTRFKELMDQGLDAMLEDEVQQTAIDVAAACGNLPVLELFEKKA